MVPTFAFSLFAGAFCCDIARCEEMRWKNLIEASRPCDNASGNEIRKTRHLTAPEGKAFEKDSVKVTADATRSFTEASGPSGCFLGELDWQKADVHTRSGKTVSIPILKGFNVSSHADCGSGDVRTAEHIAKGDRISTTFSFGQRVRSQGPRVTTSWSSTRPTRPFPRSSMLRRS